MSQTNLNWLIKEKQVIDVIGSACLNGEISGTIESSIVTSFKSRIHLRANSHISQPSWARSEFKLCFNREKLQFESIMHSASTA